MTTHFRLKWAIAILLFIVFGFISGCVSSSDTRTPRQKFSDGVKQGLAIQDLKKAGKAEKQYLLSIYASLKNKQYNNAINQAENLKSAHPNDEDLFYLQGIAYFGKNDLASAQSYFEKTISMNHNRGDAYYYSAQMFFKLDKPKKALDAINTAINNKKTAFQLMNQEKLRFGGNWSVEGRRASLFYLRALIHNDLGQKDNALSDIDTAISISPYESASHFEFRGELYFFKSKFIQAYKDFQKALELNPTMGNPWQYMGLIDTFMGRYDKAVVNYNKAVELEPDRLSDVLGDLGLTYWLKGDKNTAMEAMGKAIRKNPDYSMYYHLAYFQHLMGNPAQARKNFKKAEQLEPRILNTKSYVLSELLPKNSHIHKFSLQEYETAKKYLGTGNTATANTKKNTTPILTITSLTLEPDPVPVNTAFDIKIKFNIDIPGAGNNRLPIAYYFKFYKNKKLVSTSKEVTIDIINGKVKSRIRHMDPIPQTGIFTITAVITHKQMTDKKSVLLTIE